MALRTGFDVAELLHALSREYVKILFNKKPAKA